MKYNYVMQIEIELLMSYKIKSKLNEDINQGLSEKQTTVERGG